MSYFNTLSRNSLKLPLFQKSRWVNVKHCRRPIYKDSIQAQPRKPFTSIAIGSLLGGLLIYDGLVNEFTYCGASVRFLRSLKVAVLISYDYFRLKDNDPEYDKKIKQVHQASADRLLEACLKNGGLYIKVGQGLAAINHILPKEYTRTLAKLQDKCLPTSKDDVDKVFLMDFGTKPENIYAEFDYKPVAAASIAQVFKAKLKSGQEVAVKIQYSDLQKRFVSDLGTIIFLHDIVELFFSGYNFGWILRDLKNNLIQELDFIKEGNNVEKCAQDLKTLNFVYIPKVYWPQTKTRVLTLEWIDGMKISDIKSLEKNKINIKDVDEKLYQMFSEQIFSTGFVHADPHSSNIFVRKNLVNGRTELVLLDHGLYEVLSPNIRQPLCEFWEASVLRDEQKMKNAAQQLGIKDYMKFAEVLFQQPINLHGGTIKTKLSEKDVIYMQEVAQKNFESIMSMLKEMPRNMLFVVRNLNTVRAIGQIHGDVVNRPKVMAHCAQKCIYKNCSTVVCYFRWLLRRIYFEYSLYTLSMKRSCLQLYLNFLYQIGRSPASARTILDQMTHHSLDQ